jgi:UDP-glucose 4-epimerase
MGAHLTQVLLDHGKEVVVLDDLSGGFVDNVDKRAPLVAARLLIRSW